MQVRVVLPVLVLLASSAFGRPAVAGDCDPVAAVPKSGTEAELAKALRDLTAWVRKAGGAPDAAKACPGVSEALRGLAAGMQEIGEYRAAGQACELLGRVAPLRGPDLVTCARPLLSLGSVREAQALLDRAVEEAGPDPRTRVRAVLEGASVLEANSRFAAAADLLATAENAAPEDRTVAIRRVRDLLQAGRSGDAARAAEAAARRVKDGATDLLRETCVLMLKHRERARAAALAELLVETGVQTLAELDAVGAVVEGTGDPNLARRAAEALLARTTPAEALAVVREVSRVLERHGLADLAAHVMRSAARGNSTLDPEDWFRLGRLEVRAGRPDDAAEAFGTFLASPVRPTDAVQRVADAWLAARQPGRAAKVVKAAMDGRAVDADLVLVLGRALHEAGDDAGESAAWATAADQGTDPAGLWLRVGDAMLARPDARRAANAFRLAIAASQTPVQRGLAHAGLAEATLAQDRHAGEAAEHELMTALEEGGSDPAVLERVQKAARPLGPSGILSLAVLERLAQRTPERPDLWWKLGTAYVDAKRPRDARDAFEHFVKGSTDRPGALAEAIALLVRAKLVAPAIHLLGRYATGTPTPAVSEAVARACLDAGDRNCASRYFDAFLAGPINLEYDYLGLAEALVAAGFHRLADLAVDCATRTLTRDRRWEAEATAGRVLLARGRVEEADGRFRKALEEAPQKRLLVGRIAREFSAAGRLTMASAWYARALEDPDPAFRIQVLPALVETLWRLGRTREIAPALAKAAGTSWRNAGLLRTVASQVARAGLAGEAADLIGRGLDALPEDRDRAELLALRLRLLVSAGRVAEADRTARALCEGQGEPDAIDGICVEVTRVIAEAPRPDLAARLLRERLASGGGAAIRIELATLLLRTHHREGALALIVEAAGTVRAPSELIRAFGETLLGWHLVNPWLDVLHRLAARPDFASDPDLLFELGRTHLAAGNEGGALLAFKAFLDRSRQGTARVYQELASSGSRAAAVRLLGEALPPDLAAMDPADLRGVGDDLLHFGRRDAFVKLLDRYREANGGIAGADEAIGGVLEDLGWHARAVEALRRVPDPVLSGNGRLALVRALWMTGARDEARDVAVRGLTPPKVVMVDAHPDPWVQETMDFLAAEDATPALVAVVDRVDSIWGAPPGLKIAKARALGRALSKEDAQAARATFLSALGALHGLPLEAVEYVRLEARRGTLPELVDELEQAGPGRSFAQAALLAACLADRKDSYARALDAVIGPREDADADGLLAAAESLLQCGKWEAADDLAERGLERLGGAEAPDRAARIALVAGMMWGRSADVRARIEKTINSRTEDIVSRQLSLAAARAVVGDSRGLAATLGEVAQLGPQELPFQNAALEAAVWAGDDARLPAIEGAFLQGTDGQSQGLQRLVGVYRKALRDDLALPRLREYLKVYPTDRGALWLAFDVAVRSGDVPEAEAAARAWEDLSGNRRLAIAEVAETAASQLVPEIVRARIDALSSGPPDQQVARTLFHAGLMNLRLGARAEGLDLIGRARRQAVDVEDLVSMVAQDALVDASMPAGALDGFPAKDGKTRGAGDVPYVQAARCLLGAGDEAAVTACTAQLIAMGFRPAAILSAVLGRKLADGGFDAVPPLLRATVALDGTRSTRLHIASDLMECLGDVSSAPVETRRTLGGLALGLIDRTDVRPDPSTTPLRAHLTEMARGLRNGLALYEAEVPAAPSDAALRNNLAYLLSIAGGDQGRAASEARAAEALLSQNNGFYVETEAWAEFQNGNPGKALDRQLAARRLWNLEQGGGLAESFVHLGRMLEAAARRADAAEAYRRAATLEPTQCAGHRALLRLRALGAAH